MFYKYIFFYKKWKCITNGKIKKIKKYSKKSYINNLPTPSEMSKLGKIGKFQTDHQLVRRYLFQVSR